jgi:hypothetical protein
MNSGDVSKYYNLMLQPYDSAPFEEQEFWKWIMVSLMPEVSKDWSERLKGKRITTENVITGDVEDEDIHHYLTTSDFAYVPMVIKIYGQWEQEQDEMNVTEVCRKRGRKKGQSGMMSKENIAQYVESMIKMKSVFESTENRSNVKSWGDAAFEHIKSEALELANVSRLSSEAVAAAARAEAELNIRKKRKDEIVIPV